MVHIFSPCCLQKAVRSGRRAMLPSGLTTSQMTAASLSPASRARSTLPSVWPARTSTPPSRARRPSMWPLPRTRSAGVELSSMATATVRARSKAEMPVVMPVRASNFTVNGVALGSALTPAIGSRCNRSQKAGAMARQTMPQALRIMKLITSGVAFSAAMTRSPSFSRLSSSTRTIIRPRRSSSSASSMLQNGTVVAFMLVPRWRRCFLPCSSSYCILNTSAPTGLTAFSSRSSGARVMIFPAPHGRRELEYRLQPVFGKSA